MGKQVGKVCYTTRDAACLLDVSASTVANWMDAGHLPGFRTAGGHRRIPADALDAFAAHHGMRTPPPRHEPAEAPGVTRGRPHLLIVDDDPDFGATIRDYMVRKFEWAATVVTSAFEAGIGAARTPPDAILLDIRLREMDGFRVLAALRADASLSRVRVYACTGWRDPEVDRRIRASGFAGCFYKPVDLPTLGAVLVRDHARTDAPGDGKRQRGGARWMSGAR